MPRGTVGGRMARTKKPRARSPWAAARVRRKPGVSYSALVPNLRGLDSATRAGMQEIAVFMAASQTHNRKNINKSTEEALATYREVVHEARARGMSVRGYVSTVYGCPYEGSISLDSVVRVASGLLEMGVYEISLGDTIGVGTPRQVEYILDGLLAAGIGLEQLAVHFHDTRGTALANITVALQLGVRTVDSAVGGLGGCPYAPGASGNVATEDVVYMLHGMGVQTGVDLDRLVSVSAGLSGQLARELPSKYLKAHLSHGRRENLVAHQDDPRLQLVVVDLRDDFAAALAGLPRPDAVLHLAAQVSVPRSLRDPVVDLDINLRATVRLLQWAAAAGVRRLVLASSAAVYGDPARMPVSEDMCDRPAAPYGASKRAAELYLACLGPALGVETVALRLFNVYGPRQDPGSPYSGVVSLFMARALGGEPLTVQGDGAQTRDFVYVGDVARAFAAAMDTPGVDGLIANIGSERTMSPARAGA